MKMYEEMAAPKVRPTGEGGCEQWRRGPKREKLPAASFESSGAAQSLFKDGYRAGDAPQDDD